MSLETSNKENERPAETILDEYVTGPVLVHQELHDIVTYRTFQRWCRNQMGPPSTMLGRHRLFRRSAVRAWLEKKETARFVARPGGRKPRRAHALNRRRERE